MNDVLKINVSGRCFHVSKQILKQFPDSTLSRLAQQTNYSDDVIFDRPAAIFETILSFYQTNKLHMPNNVCPATFKTELDFWGFSPDLLEACCRRKYIKFVQEQRELEKFEKFTSPKERVPKPTGGCCRWRHDVWEILDNPWASTAGKVYFVIASVMVVTSTLLVIANSHPSFRHDLTRADWRHYFAEKWYEYEEDIDQWMEPHDEENMTLQKGTVEELKKPSKVYDFVLYVSFFCIVFFTIELFVRLFVCPSRRAFFKSVLNVVDTLAVIVSVMEVIANLVVNTELYETTYVDILSCFQILRVLRLYRLTGHITGARVLIYAIRISANELIFMALLLTINTIIFGTIVFYADQDNMGNILTGCWWAVITMTTVGYGDVYPSTAVGKLVGVFCAAMGIMVIAITVPLFVNNFITYYIYAEVKPQSSPDRKYVTKTKSPEMKDIHLEDLEKEVDVSKTAQPCALVKRDDKTIQ